MFMVLYVQLPLCLPTFACRNGRKPVWSWWWTIVRPTLDFWISVYFSALYQLAAVVWRWMMYIKSRVGRGWALSWNILKYFPSIIVEQLSRRRKNAGFSQDVFSLIAEWGRYFEGWPVSVLRTGVAYGRRRPALTHASGTHPSQLWRPSDRGESQTRTYTV